LILPKANATNKEKEKAQVLTSNEALKEFIEKEKKKKEDKEAKQKKQKERERKRLEKQAWKEELRLKKLAEKGSKKKTRKQNDLDPVIEAEHRKWATKSQNF